MDVSSLLMPVGAAFVALAFVIWLLVYVGGSRKRLKEAAAGNDPEAYWLTLRSDLRFGIPVQLAVACAFLAFGFDTLQNNTPDHRQFPFLEFGLAAFFAIRFALLVIWAIQQNGLDWDSARKTTFGGVAMRRFDRLRTRIAKTQDANADGVFE